MRVICPHCQKSVTLPDTVAEQPTPCPECKNIFTAPALMAVPPEPPPAPKAVEPVIETPPPAPPVVPQTAPPPPAAAAPPATPGVKTFTLNKRFVQWMGPIGLVLFFLATYFPWVGAYPGGYGVYTQTGWQIFRGAFTPDPVGEEMFAMEETLKANSSYSLLQMLALFVCIPAVGIALLDLFEEYVTFSVPDAIQSIWPHRRSALALVAMFVFAIINLNCLWGLGLESAAAKAAVVKATPAVDPSKPADAAKAEPTPKAIMLRELKAAEEFGRLSIGRTTAFRIGYWALAISVIGYVVELWLTRRGKRPEPRMELHW